MVSYYQTHMKEEELVDYDLEEGVFNKFWLEPRILSIHISKLDRKVMIVPWLLVLPGL